MKMLCNNIISLLYHIHMPGLPVNPAHGIVLLHYSMSSARDGGQDIFFYWPAKRCHCAFSINWTSAVVADRGFSVTLECITPTLSLLKTSRPVRHMKECQQVYFTVPWSINAYAPGKGMQLMAFAATTKDTHFLSISDNAHMYHVCSNILCYMCE